MCLGEDQRLKGRSQARWKQEAGMALLADGDCSEEGEYRVPSVKEKARGQACRQGSTMEDERPMIMVVAMTVVWG